MFKGRLFRLPNRFDEQTRTRYLIFIFEFHYLMFFFIFIVKVPRGNTSIQ